MIWYLALAYTIHDCIKQELFDSIYHKSSLPRGAQPILARWLFPKFEKSNFTKSIRFRGGKETINVIKIYVSQIWLDKNTKYKFWEDLDEII